MQQGSDIVNECDLKNDHGPMRGVTFDASKSRWRVRTNDGRCISFPSTRFMHSGRNAEEAATLAMQHANACRRALLKQGVIKPRSPDTSGYKNIHWWSRAAAWQV